MAPRLLLFAGLSPLSAAREGLPEHRGTLQPACVQMVSLPGLICSRLAPAACHCKIHLPLPQLSSGPSRTASQIHGHPKSAVLSTILAVTEQSAICCAASWSPPTVSDTKAAFYENFKKPIPPIYNTVIQELLVQQHLMRWNKNYQFDEVSCFPYTQTVATCVCSGMSSAIAGQPAVEGQALLPRPMSEAWQVLPGNLMPGSYSWLAAPQPTPASNVTATGPVRCYLPLLLGKGTGLLLLWKMLPEAACHLYLSAAATTDPASQPKHAHTATLWFNITSTNTRQPKQSFDSQAAGWPSTLH